MAAGGRRRRLQMRGGSKVAGAGGADLMKPHGEIGDLVKSTGCSGEFAACGIRTHAGASGIGGPVVKPGAAKSVVKPCGTNSTEAWICVCGCRIERAGLRFNSQGDVYVPDSEDEDVGPEVAANGAVDVELAPVVASDRVAGVDLTLVDAADGAAGVDVAPTVTAAGAASVDVAPAVAADGVAGVEMNPEVAGRLAKKVLRDDLHPDVAARLAEVLFDIEPFYHELLIAMYKVMVPLFFTPPP
ncbi:hypothetical protein C2845_PM01G15680 [Panicum miliaceum]|uniref:Uncharacterized protein n=1 Tax=Panicum miliaceum TaxID=4540 RepID=A0A3L6TT75_PANMI|nr:hypothetical protein C2845_PM01G15680 [Panicum miliaceum]